MLRQFRNSHGFTLMEIVAVVVILGIMAAVAMRSIDKALDTAKVESTRKEMEQIAYAIGGNPNLFANGVRTDFGYVGDVGSLPPNLDALSTNPGGYATWNGPYISSEFTEAPDEFKRDAWGDLYTFDGLTLSSNGGGKGTFTRQICTSISQLTSNSVSGMITDAAGNPPGDSSSSVRIILSLPNGAGGMVDSITQVSGGGSYSFPGGIPVGNHTLRAVYAATADTVRTNVAVYPGGESFASLRFPGAIWASVGEEGGGSSGAFAYVPGSANCPGGQNEDINFEMENSSPDIAVINWIIVEYSHSPNAYFEVVRWANNIVFQSTAPRAASGDTLYFNAPKSLNPYQRRVIRLQNFRDVQSGSGVNVNMGVTDMTVKCDDGSILNFNSGT